MTNEDRQHAFGTDAQEAAERRASTSEESPTNVTRSTQDLTIGGSEKTPDDAGTHSPSSEANENHEQREQSADRRSTSEQAVENQERALEGGEESPG